MNVRAASPESLTHIQTALGCPLTASARGIEAVSMAGKVKGILAFDGWTENSVQCHIIATPLATIHLVKAGREYIFRTLGLGLIFCSIRSDNLRALRFAQHACFEVEHKVRDVYGRGVDLVLLRMRREDYMLQFADLENAA